MSVASTEPIPENVQAASAPTAESTPAEPVAAPVTTLEPSKAVEPAAPAAVTPSEEPQNALTKKFTEAEWESLKKLRAELPEAFKEAYPDSPAAQTAPATLWGITIDPSKPGADARVSVILMKFLRARSLNVQEGKAMLVATLRWRDLFNIEAALKEEYPEDIFGGLGVISGRDKENRPVVYNVYGANPNTTAVFSDVQRFLRWRVALMEKSLALLDFETVDQTVQIHDYAGISMFGRDANSKQAASEASAIFQDYYPELLHLKFFINVPAIMSWMFWFYTKLLSPKTAKKMSMIGSGKSAIHHALSPVIDDKQLPKRYGGEAEAF